MNQTSAYNYLEVIPNNQISLASSDSNNEATLTLKNLTGFSVIFRVYITSTCVFSTPSLGYVSPKSQINLHVKKKLNTEEEKEKVTSFKL